jgi:hypothetical protein
MTPTTIALTAKGIVKKQASTGIKGKARLMASDMKIPDFTSRICRMAETLRNRMSMLTFLDFFSQFLDKR